MALTADTLKRIFLPLGLRPEYWNTTIPKASLFDLVSQVSSTPSAQDVSVTPTGNLSSTDVQSALEELQSDIDLLVSGSLPYYTKTFSNVTTDSITAATHLLPRVNNVVIKTPTDQIVSVQVQVDGTTVNIDSNIPLTNHKLLIY